MARYVPYTKKNASTSREKIDFYKKQDHLRGLAPTLKEFRLSLSRIFKPELVDEIMSVRTSEAFREYCEKLNRPAGDVRRTCD